MFLVDINGHSFKQDDMITPAKLLPTEKCLKKEWLLPLPGMSRRIQRIQLQSDMIVIPRQLGLA